MRCLPQNCCAQPSNRSGQMHLLFIFLDGIGLGDDDPHTNPFATADTPVLHALANGRRWLRSAGRQESERAVFLPLDAGLGVVGRPQSGTSQAAMLTGRNVPKITGRHYGPKPDAATRALLAEDNFFKQVLARGQRAALINAYPPSLLSSIARGKTLGSSIQHAAMTAGLPLFGIDELRAGDALSEDWTGAGWRTHLGFTDVPVFTPEEAGQHMVMLARRYTFAFCSHWLTDVTGHRGTLSEAVALLETFDGVMRGVLDRWNDDEGLIVVTSDHGNLEVIGDRHHTENPVPAVIVGTGRHAFAEGLTDLTGLVARMTSFLFPD